MYVLFSTGCPKCNVLKKKLDNANIEYKVCDDVEKIKSAGIDAVPCLLVDGNLLNFTAAVDFINLKVVEESSNEHPN